VAAADVWRAFLSGDVYLGGTRYAAEGFDPNDLAVTLAIGVPIAAHLALERRRWKDCWALAYFPLSLSAIVLSGSRGGALTASVGLASVMAWKVGGKSARTVLALMLLLGAGMAVVWRSVPQDSWARIFTVREQLAAGSMGDRLQIWRAGVDVFMSHPLAGVGAGGFSRAVAVEGGVRMVAHNTPLSVAVELGMIGVLLFFGALASVLRGVMGTKPEMRALAATLVLTWCMGSASLTWEHRKTTWFVLLIGAALGALRPGATRVEGR
jgi:O-antigen ligase